MKKTLIILWVLGLGTSCLMAQNRSVKFETGPFSDVLAKAKKENKPIMMDAYTTWCGPCKMMDKEVFTNDTIADFYNANFIPFKSDMEKGEGKDLAQRYNVRAYPNFIFISPDGSVMHRTVGFNPVPRFLAIGKTALNPELNFGTLQRKYDSGERSPDLVLSYIYALDDAALPFSKELKDYITSQKDTELTGPGNWKLLKNMGRSLEEPEAKRFITQREAFTKKYGVDSVNKVVTEIYQSRLFRAARNGNMEDVQAAKKELTAMNLKGSDEMILTAEAMVYKKKGDLPKYAEITNKLVNTYYLNDAGMLNNVSWDYYENITDKKMLANAEKWSKKSVELQPNYANTDTYAAILYKLGKKKEAQTAAKKAIALGKKAGENVEETEALLIKINALK